MFFLHLPKMNAFNLGRIGETLFEAEKSPFLTHFNNCTLGYLTFHLLFIKNGLYQSIKRYRDNEKKKHDDPNLSSWICENE